jgi:sugar phosphate isomerase/epimerase
MSQQPGSSAGRVAGELLDRRQFLGAAAGTAAALSVSGWSATPAHAHGNHGHGGALIPARNRGIILFAVRDAIGRDPASTDQPSGFRAVFERLAQIGYKQIEFAGYTQHANAEGGAQPSAALLRSWLDEYGLEAAGRHGFIPATLGAEDIARWHQEMDFSETLGMPNIGTGNDPTRSRYRADWDAAADHWNAIGDIARRRGFRLYTHNHDQAYNFLLDRGPLDDQGNPTRSSGKRMLEYFFEISDPRAVYFQFDIFWGHVAQHRYQTYIDRHGRQRRKIFDPAGAVAPRARRFPLFHAKDGTRTDEPPEQGMGWEMVPFGQGDIDFARFFTRIGNRGNYIPLWEQDNAPSATDPGQSLRFAEISYRALSRLLSRRR